jgi:CDP-glycerol glycerophosphotransferase (TagB/SpsB family)
MIKLIENIFAFIFRILCSLVPKDANMFLIGTAHGKSFSDNSLYFFQYLEKLKNPALKYFVITKDKVLFQSLKKSYGSKIIYAYSFKAIKVYCRSKTVLCTHGYGDIYPFRSSNSSQVVINMWHGTPIKNIGYLTKDMFNNNGVKLVVDNNFDYFLVSSSVEIPALSKAFGVNPEVIKPIGIPRNDILANHKQVEKVDSNEKVKVLYLPTFRDFEALEYFPFNDYNSVEFNEFLNSKNIEIIIKPHMNNMAGSVLEEKTKDIDNIIIKGDKNVDLQNLLIESDILITDYSSVFFDFLLLDRPLIFFPYDLKEYEASRGFIYDYDEVSPGDKVYTQKAFLDSLSRYISNPNKDSDKRAIVRDRFHTFQDGNTCKRLVELILEK